MKKIVVLGAGSWGTAIAKLLCENGHSVTLWSHEKKQIDAIILEKENKEYLPGVHMPPTLQYAWENQFDMAQMDVVVLAVPSKFIRAVVRQFANHMPQNTLIVNLAKGFEDNTLLRLSSVIQEEASQCQICVLSGPTHAEEVSRHIPTTIVAAAENLSVAEQVQDLFMNPTFRVYTNTDLVGVELGGALKNVIALAAGISDGLGFGDNTKAALMTRGLNEIRNLGIAMGGAETTFNGLTGIGDLIVTCTSMHSRNRRAGILMGKGKTLNETLAEIHMVVEGVSNAKAAYGLSQKYNVEMPIVSEIYSVLFEDKNPKEAVHALMTRAKKAEHSGENDFIMYNLYQ